MKHASGTTMKHHALITTALCSLVLFSGIALAAEKKPRKPREAPSWRAEVIADLTGRGVQRLWSDAQSPYSACSNRRIEYNYCQSPAIIVAQCHLGHPR